MQKFSLAFIVVLLSLSASLAKAANENFELRPLDGVNVEALETYQNPRTHQIDFGLGVWPFNAYFTGFSLNFGYTAYFSRDFAWQVIDGAYLYSVEKNLASELAERYGVNPEQIKRPNYLITSNLHYVHAYGKFIFLKEYIRYFRSAFLLGPAMIATNQGTDVGASLGWRFEVFANNSFSWKLELRNIISADKETTNNFAFVVGTSYGI